jgi:hypothetical protein
MGINSSVNSLGQAIPPLLLSTKAARDLGLDMKMTAERGGNPTDATKVTPPKK